MAYKPQIPFEENSSLTVGSIPQLHGFPGLPSDPPVPKGMVRYGVGLACIAQHSTAIPVSSMNLMYLGLPLLHLIAFASLN